MDVGCLFCDHGKKVSGVILHHVVCQQNEFKYCNNAERKQKQILFS